jgi:hypothetical protein
LAVEFAIGRQRVRIARIDPRRGVRACVERDYLRAAAALLPGVMLAPVTEVMLQRPEQIVAKSPASWFRAAEIRLLEQVRKEFMRDLPRGIRIASAAKKGDNRFVIGRT